MGIGQNGTFVNPKNVRHGETLRVSINGASSLGNWSLVIFLALHNCGMILEFVSTIITVSPRLCFSASASIIPLFSNAKFFTSSDIFKMYLSIDNTPLDDSALLALLTPVRHDSSQNQSFLYELPSLFSHINFRLIEMLSVNQHGDFVTRSKKGKNETIVELGGHISQRHPLNQKELLTIQQIYQQIWEINVIRWLQSRR